MKYDVFYLLVITSNVSSFVCLGTEGDYFSPYCIHGVEQVVCHEFLCVVRIVAHDIPVWHNFNEGKSCCTPQDCLTAPLGSLQILQCLPMTRNVAFLVIRTPAYYFNHLHLLHKQQQRSNCGGYLVINIARSLFCRNIRASILVIAYHCAARELNDPPSWVPRSLCTHGPLIYATALI